MLLLKADKLRKQIDEECESMDGSDYWRMVLDQHRDREWQIINKMLPRTPYGTDDVDMMKWVIHTQRLRLAWIKKWKAKHRHELNVSKYLGLEYALRSHSVPKILYYFATAPFHFFISLLNFVRVMKMESMRKRFGSKRRSLRYE